MEAKIKAITPARDNPRGTRLVLPLSAKNSLNEAFTEMICRVPVLNRAPVDVASDTDRPKDSAEEEEYKEDDESDEEEDDSDDGDEVESSRSDEHVPETRSKACQDPGVRGGNTKVPSVAKLSVPALPTRSSQRGRGELVSSPEMAAKQPKVTAVKPQKAVFVPKIKMNIPVASAADTSTASLEPQALEKDRADADVASSKAPREVIHFDGDEKVDLPNPSADADVVIQEPSRTEALALARQTNSGAGAAVGTGTLTPSPAPPAASIFALHHVPED